MNNDEFRLRQRLDDFRDAIFVKVMARAKEQNRSLDPWNLDMNFLKERLAQELREFAEAYKRQDADDVRGELCDVAAFCFFMWAKLLFETPAYAWPVKEAAQK